MLHGSQMLLTRGNMKVILHLSKHLQALIQVNHVLEETTMGLVFVYSL